MKKNAFFLGKGGVGKTTLSAAFALSQARAGRRTLVVSLDPAHNLGDVLGVKLKDAPREVERGLWAMEIDLAAWVEKYLDESRDEMKSTYSYNSTLNLDSFFGIMRYSPGTEEYAVLWAIENVHCTLSADYDVVVYDTPPTALSLRFLAMPAISKLWIAELSKLRARILEKRQVVTKLNPESPVASSCVDKADDKVYGRLGAIKDRLAVLSRLFSEESYMSVVLNPDALSVSEALRIQDELDRIDIGLSAVCINKKGMSTAAWSLDRKLAAIPSFVFDFLPGGLRDRGDLGNIGMESLSADFNGRGSKGSA